MAGLQVYVLAPLAVSVADGLPAHTAAANGLTTKLGDALTINETLLLVTTLGLAQVALLVNTHVIISLLAKLLLLKVSAVKPANTLPFLNH